MVLQFVVSFLMPVFLTLIITPLVIKFAQKIGATDAPGERKVHTSVMPRIGGLGVFLSVFISIITLGFLFPDLFSSVYEDSKTASMLVFCFVSLFALGFWDDLKPLSPEVKFGVQFLLAAIIYFAGFKISNITNPLGAGMLDVGIIDFPLTILWIVGITNAFNLIDGLDGLASGVAVIASVSIFVVSAMEGQIVAAILALSLAGSLVGFLRYNFNPAKIFLGDSGSLIIGFALALLSIQSTAKITTGFALLFPILVLVLPITDTIISMMRRLIGSFLKRKSGGKSISLLRRLHGMFTPDKSHIHHRLLSLGLSHRNTVLVLYSVSAFFAFSAFLFTQINTVQRSFTIAITLAVILFVFIKKLRYHEIAIFNNGLMMPFYEKWVLKRSAFISLADILFITTAYTLSYALVHSVNPETTELMPFQSTLITILPVQLAIFWLTGLYREKINQFGIGNTLHVVRSVAYAIGASAFILLIVNVLPLLVAIQFLVLDFYFLLTLVLGFRMTYQALCFWFNRGKQTGENVLIYGANEDGTTLLHKIVNSPNYAVKVVGFLDDDPGLEGKLIYGYPILGGHWKLARMDPDKSIDSVYICDDGIKCENLKRLRETARKKGIAIKKMNVTLQNIVSDQQNGSQDEKAGVLTEETAVSYENSAV